MAYIRGTFYLLYVRLQCGGIMFACSLITWLRQRITDDYWWCYDDEFVE